MSGFDSDPQFEIISMPGEATVEPDAIHDADDDDDDDEPIETAETAEED
jgi:hypothetical protein